MKKYIILLLLVPLLVWGQTGKFGFGTQTTYQDSLDADQITVDTLTVGTHILPDANNGADLGTEGTQWESLFAGDIVTDIATIKIGRAHV